MPVLLVTASRPSHTPRWVAGNPLFVEDIARPLTERSLLVSKSGGVVRAGAALVESAARRADR